MIIVTILLVMDVKKIMFIVLEILIRSTKEINDDNSIHINDGAWNNNDHGRYYDNESR